MMAIQKRNDELIDLLSADFLRSKLPIVAHNGIGGFWDGAFEVPDSTTIVILGDANPYRVTRLLRYSVVPVPSAVPAGEILVASDNSLEIDDSKELYNDGDSILEIRVTASGGVEVQRTAGTVTYSVKLRLDWV